MSSSLGQYIRSRRLSSDISLRRCASDISVSAAFLSDIELGRRFPSNKVLSKIASVLGVNKSDLIDRIIQDKVISTRDQIDELKRIYQ